MSPSVVAFLALCERDLYVTFRRDLVAFLSQALLQPIFFLFVFGRVLPEIGAAQGSYGTQLLPGVIALTLVLTALQNVALPLVIEFSFTKEIEDRLLAPLPVAWVAIQKVLIAALRGIVGGVLIIPLGELILPGGVDLSGVNWPALIVMIVAGALAGAVIGLVLGTAVPPSRITVAFGLILTPLIFTGAAFYPWDALDSLRWFQVLTLLNPMTYVSEGMRGALTDVPHLAAGWVALGLIVSLAAFGWLGVRGFVRRAVD
ncbi:ABC transporter permease [Capillimicrobium parvum]|uniref:Transport permease protein n=1 Tax=Capillimicrobium parvum TaxID=2884022 RepID=A0A9E6Y189_9ACTN|nr:ABC transporter permease [Capillimicrobium parvum]UGS38244.1 Inner membrane transport permease YadH [Capillimicrobium parvum]